MSEHVKQVTVIPIILFCVGGKLSTLCHAFLSLVCLFVGVWGLWA